MTLTTPLALVLLLLIPVIIYLGWPRNRFRRARDISSLVLRVIIVLLLVFALAGTQIVESADRLAVVFLLDMSDSMSAVSQEAALEYIREAMSDMRPDDEAAVVAFGTDAQVARSMSPARELGPIRADPNASNSNIAAAVRLGLALFPEGAARRMVVLTDGLATIGDTEGAAQLASAAGVEISYVLFTRPPEPEIQVRDVIAPSVVDEDQEFDMTITIASEEPTAAVVTIMASGQIVNQQNVNLQEGTNNYTLRLRSGSAGFRDWMVSIDPASTAADGFYQNNSLGAFTRVEGTSRVLVVGNESQDDTRYIVPALQENGLEVDLTTPNNLPLGVTGLAQYDSVVLVNVPATQISNRRMEVLRGYVSDVGGGLVVVGGPDSYGPGGYFQTPLEDALPVETQIRDQERLPQLTIAYLIDRSGSMGAVGPSGFSNIDLAKAAIIRSVDFLQPTDRVGITSFDTDAYWIAEFQDVENRRELQRLVGSLRSSGGTSIMAGMQLVARDIIREESQLKHIVLLTDGGADSRGLVDLVERLHQEAGVTTSVISIGSFEVPFLQAMADAGDGNYHNIIDAESIPTIFTLETVLATRTYIQEETFTPQLTAIHPIMQSIEALPQLQGYVAASERAAAQVILRGPAPYEDPLLVAWQYGLGRSVAFTSDATARWGQNWVTWDEFATFWGQAVRWTMTEGASRNLETRVVMEGEQARVTVDARDNNGDFLNGLELQTSVLYPDQQADRIRLRQTAPGRYEATFIPSIEGAYLFTVTNQGADDQLEELELRQLTGWVMSYSPEYDVRDYDETLMETIANLTDGRNMTETPEAVYEHNLTTRSASVPLWPLLLLGALVLLPFDIGVRRLLVTRTDLRRFSTWMRGTVLRGERRQLAREAAAERVTTLLQARDRARHRAVDQPEQQTPTPAPTQTVGALRRRTAESREHRSGGQAAQEQREAVPAPSKPRYDPKTQPVQHQEGNIGSRLLKRRRPDSDE